MSVLVVAEHDNSPRMKPATLNTVTRRRRQIGGDVHVLVAGKVAAPSPKPPAKIAGVAKVLHVADDAATNTAGREPGAADRRLAAGYSHVLGPGHDLRQERRHARRGAAGCAADFRHRRRSSNGRYLRAPDLCRQRDGDGEIVRCEERSSPCAAPPSKPRRPRAGPPRSKPSRCRGSRPFQLRRPAN